MTSKSANKANKAKPAAKTPKLPAGELTSNALDSVTGGLSSTGGVAGPSVVCVSQT
jgi:hypothetical protein